MQWPQNLFDGEPDNWKNDARGSHNLSVQYLQAWTEGLRVRKKVYPATLTVAIHTEKREPTYLFSKSLSGKVVLVKKIVTLYLPGSFMKQIWMVG